MASLSNFSGLSGRGTVENYPVSDLEMIKTEESYLLECKSQIEEVVPRTGSLDLLFCVLKACSQASRLRPLKNFLAMVIKVPDTRTSRIPKIRKYS